jgi:N-ethylmaleimide reductase
MDYKDKPITTEIAASDLFKAAELGAIKLSNRIVMAPLTRSRGLAGDIPGPLNAEYYAQRATAGLIISEATQISPQGKGYAFTPGIYSTEQVEGWKLVTKAVHAQGGKMFAQLWHVGRISHPDLQPNGELPVAPSAIKAAGDAFTASGFKPFVTPRALETKEIPGIVDQYVHAAKCAKSAGFDGVEIHSANGYLLDQFIKDQTNKRTDQYGGSIENRTRLVLEVIEAITSVWPAQSIGIRLSPVSPHIDISDSQPMQTFSYLVKQLNNFKIAYLHFIEGSIQASRNAPPGFSFAELRKLFNGSYIANNMYDIEAALKARIENSADLICFGRPFLANPDLVRRMYIGAELATAPKEFWYGGDAKGYTDWPTLDEK